MISYSFRPPAVEDVKKSYATSAIIPDELLMLQSHVVCKMLKYNVSKSHSRACGGGRTGIDVMADNWTSIPTSRLIFEKLLTPPPVDHCHVVLQATSVPLEDRRVEHCDPLVVDVNPQRLVFSV